VHRLSVKLHLACRERSFDKLHLQCRINGAGWRPVRSACPNAPSCLLACNAGYFGETNAVEYKGLVYRTLNGVSPLDTNFQCQNYYLPLPSGWVLAADNADSRYIIGAYLWGTDALVVANGYGYRGGSYGPPRQSPGSAGSYHGSSFLITYASTYKVIDCYPSTYLLILISKSGSACTACPAGESEIPGRECGTRLCERVWWETACECIPLAERACRMTVRGTRHARL
jgi:hypothetical protein